MRADSRPTRQRLNVFEREVSLGTATEEEMTGSTLNVCFLLIAEIRAYLNCKVLSTKFSHLYSE